MAETSTLSPRGRPPRSGNNPLGRKAASTLYVDLVTRARFKACGDRLSAELGFPLTQVQVLHLLISSYEKQLAEKKLIADYDKENRNEVPPV